MDVTTLKIIMLAAMFLVTMICGLAPIKVLKYITDGSSPVFGSRASFIISIISCFAGGVFLSVCFLDMMPDALEAMNDIKTDTGFTSDYPFVPLLFCVGFFFVWIFEEICGRLCGHDSHESEKATVVIDLEANVKPFEKEVEIRRRATTFHSIMNSDLGIVERGKPKENKLINSLTFITALLFHAGLEGFAFGVQDSTVSVTSLFFGIIVHKAVVSFSTGMRLVRAHPEQAWLVVLLILSVAVIAPLGGAIGILVENSNMNPTTKNIVTTVLLSFALGTFIYITFFEILQPEHENEHSNIAQWFATVAGFSIIAVLMIWG